MQTSKLSIWYASTQRVLSVTLSFEPMTFNTSSVTRGPGDE